MKSPAFEKFWEVTLNSITSVSAAKMSWKVVTFDKNVLESFKENPYSHTKWSKNLLPYLVPWGPASQRTSINLLEEDSTCSQCQPPPTAGFPKREWFIQKFRLKLPVPILPTTHYYCTLEVLRIAFHISRKIHNIYHMLHYNFAFLYLTRSNYPPSSAFLVLEIAKSSQQPEKKSHRQ